LERRLVFELMAGVVVNENAKCIDEADGAADG
jgi:hypothetical protein